MAARLAAMAFDARKAASEIESNLRAIGTPERAEQEKRYLRSELAFFGTTVGQIRDVVKAYSRGHTLDHAYLVDLVTALWAEPIHERRMAAVALLELHPRLLDAPAARGTADS